MQKGDLVIPRNAVDELIADPEIWTRARRVYFASSDSVHFESTAGRLRVNIYPKSEWVLVSSLPPELQSRIKEPSK